jgi:DNA-binding response OmpR family regulator
LQQNEPDAILLDLLMPPGPTGLETLGSLRDRQVDSAVIMMSGKAQLSDAVAGHPARRLSIPGKNPGT